MRPFSHRVRVFGHSVHFVWPADAENDPSEHVKHARLASVGAYRPFAHSVQCDMPLFAFDIVPTPHTLHAVAPVTPENVPVSHA
jgi:hypothetical protein